MQTSNGIVTKVPDYSIDMFIAESLSFRKDANRGKKLPKNNLIIA